MYKGEGLRLTLLVWTATVRTSKLGKVLRYGQTGRTSSLEKGRSNLKGIPPALFVRCGERARYESTTSCAIPVEGYWRLEGTSIPRLDLTLDSEPYPD